MVSSKISVGGSRFLLPMTQDSTCSNFSVIFHEKNRIVVAEFEGFSLFFFLIYLQLGIVIASWVLSDLAA